MDSFAKAENRIPNLTLDLNWTHFDQINFKLRNKNIESFL